MSRLLARVMSLPRASDTRVTVERGVPIPMDDGCTLLADVYTPAGSGSHPTVLVRTPYGRAGPIGLFLGRAFAERGYRVVLQSCRGTYGSGGSFEPNFNERADGLATIRWIGAQPWFDGRLAMNGPSYLGAVQWAVGDAAEPPLRALCTHITYSNLARHWYRGGTFSLHDALDWTTMVSEQEHTRFGFADVILERRVRRIDRVIDHLPVAELDTLVVGRRLPFWRDVVDHASCDDPFWDRADHSSRVAHVEAPVLQTGGWYDIFLPDTITDHHTLVDAGHRPRLVVGPWTHIAPGAFKVQLRESLQWLDRHVRSDGDAGSGSTDATPVRLYVMGANRWRDFVSWPPPECEPERWCLHAHGRLDRREPDDSAPDTYTYDPAYPTPIVGGTLMRRSGGRRDQRTTECRRDVLLYTSDVLTRGVTVIGEIVAAIHVSSDLEHFDVFVRLCDVDEKGRSFNVCDGIARVSPEHWPRPASGPWAVRVDLWPTAHAFRAGHRIRLQVSSGAHPRFARNLGTGEPLATATRMRVAHQAVHHDPEHPSVIVLPVERA